MTTLASTLYALAVRVREAKHGTTTATGTTATLIDTGQVSTRDDFWNGGTLFFLDGNFAGKTAVVTDYTDTARTWTFTAFSGSASGSGAGYGVVDKTYPRLDMVGAINTALSEIGPLPNIDTSLTSVSGSSSYALPAGVSNIKRVETFEDDVWTTASQWREIDGYLAFDEEPTSGLSIRLTYVGDHPAVSADADTISPYVNVERVVWTAAFHLLQRRKTMQANNEPEIDTLLKIAEAKREELAKKYPVRIPAKTPRFNNW